MLHCLNGRLRGAIGGHQNNGRTRIKLAQALKCLDAGEAAHAHVHDHQVRRQLGDQLQRFLAAAGGVQLQPFLLAEDALKRIAHIGLVIDQQQFIHCARET